MDKFSRPIFNSQLRDKWRKIKRNGTFYKKKKAIIESPNNWMHTYAKVGNETHSQIQITNCGQQLTEQQFMVQEAADEQVSYPEISQQEAINSEQEDSLSSDDDSENSFNQADESDSDNDQSIEPIKEQLNLKDQLRFWALNHLVKQNAINSLLLILRQHNSLANLPADARTLLQTPRKSESISQLNNNEKYWHYGLQRVLKDALSSRLNIPQHLQLNVNIDGLPMFKSSFDSFWPILVNIHQLRDEISPMIVGIYCGRGE